MTLFRRERGRILPAPNRQPIGEFFAAHARACHNSLPLASFNCKGEPTPTARRDWWLAKLNGNAARDQLHQRALRQLGWRTLVVWECETEKPETLERLQKKLAEIL